MLIETPHQCKIQSPDCLPAVANCAWIYEDNRPFEVTLVTPGPQEWLFATDLLDDGLWSPVGVGDVRIWPDGKCLCISLTSPSGQARIVTDWEVAEAFVTRVRRDAPPLFEAEHFEVNVQKIDRYLRDLAKGPQT